MYSHEQYIMYLLTLVVLNSTLLQRPGSKGLPAEYNTRYDSYEAGNPFSRRGWSPSAQGLSQAGIAGMVIGLAALLAALGGIVWFKRHTLLPPKPSNRSTDPRIAFSMRTSTTGSDTSSQNSIHGVEINMRGNPTNSQRTE